MRKPGPTRGLFDRLSRLATCRRGNVSIIFAFSLMPMLLALGSGVDYGMAMKRQARMNAAADAAALDAVTPTMMAQTPATAKAAAVAFFNSQVGGMSSVTYDPSTLSVTVTDAPSSSTIKRTVTVTYRATSSNTFAALLQVPTLTIKGTSTASASVSPNIDFYLMLDNSPSMAIAATTDGIATMVANTASQNGCGFACHETNPVLYNSDGTVRSNDVPGNPNNEDNYALARYLGVTLRMDLVQQAVANLMTTARNTEASTGSVYRMAGYTFNVSVNNVIPLTSNLTLAQNETSNIQLMTVYHENMLNASTNNNDQDTDFNNAFSTLNAAMPAPGNGTHEAGDSPQEVLFLVTDGVADVNYNGRQFGPFGTGTYSGTDWCTAIKARGIRIAVLYTTYNPLPTNAFYNSHIAAEQPSIATTAQACASPNLYFQVNTGGDISAAMTTLFATAVASAHLVY